MFYILRYHCPCRPGLDEHQAKSLERQPGSQAWSSISHCEPRKGMVCGRHTYDIHLYAQKTYKFPDFSCQAQECRMKSLTYGTESFMNLGRRTQVGEITWPCHVTGVPTPQFSSNQALNSYAIFHGVGKSHFTKKQGRGIFFFLAISKENI